MSERVKCIEIVNRDAKLALEFLRWCDSGHRKIKSLNRLAYCYLKSRFGSDWIRMMRKISSDEELFRIVKTKWIKVPEYE